jgi:Flp pilus assembly protein TadG
MARRLSHFLADRSGASAVEFALVAVPLLMLIFGTLEYGRLMWTRQALQESAIAGARCVGVLAQGCTASGTYDANTARSFVRQTAQNWFVALDDADITVSNAARCGGVEGFSSITIQHEFITPVPAALVGLAEGTALSASACFPNQS